MAENVYEIRFVGDASALAAEAKKAETAVAGLGKTTEGAGKSTQLYEGSTRSLTRAFRLATFQVSNELNPMLATLVSTLDRAALAAQLTGGQIGMFAAIAIAAGAGLALLIRRIKETVEENKHLQDSLTRGTLEDLAADVAKYKKEYNELADILEAAGGKFRDANKLIDEQTYAFTTPEDVGISFYVGRLAKLEGMLGKTSERLRAFAIAFEDVPALSSFFAASADAINKTADAMRDLAIRAIETGNAISAAQREQLGLRADIARTQSEFLAPFNLTALREAISLQKQALDLRFKELEALKARPGIMPGEAAVLEAQQRSLPLQRALLDLQIKSAERARFAERVRLQAVEAGDAELSIAENLAEAERQINDLIRERAAALRAITPLQLEELQAFASFAAVTDEQQAQVAESMRRLGDAARISLAEQAESLREEGRKLGMDLSIELSKGIIEAEQTGSRATLLLRRTRAAGQTVGEQFADGFEAGLIRLRASWGTFGENMAQLTQNIGNTLARGLDDTFFSVVTGRFHSVVDVFRQMGYAIVREATSISARLAMTGLFGAQKTGSGFQLGGLFGIIAGLIGSFFGAGAGAGAGPGTLPPVTYVQRGGVFTRPTLAMIGEAGPEAVIPLDRAEREGRLDKGGGGTTVINLTDRDELAAIVAQEMSRGREVVVNDVIQGLRGNAAIRRGIRRFA